MTASLEIITISFNNFEDLVNTINSCEGANVDQLVINGGNCPKTQSFLEEGSVRFVSEPDQGISDAFNKGFKLSTGKYITYLNSGDILIDTNYYLDALRIFNENPEIDYIFADLIMSDQFAGEIRVRAGSSLPAMPFPHPTLIVRRKIIEKIGLFDLDLKIAMDLDFAYRLVRSGCKGYHMGKVVVKMDGGGVSSTKYLETYKEVVRVVIKNKDYSVKAFVFLMRRASLLLLKIILLKFGLKKIIGSYRKFRFGR